jgi:protein-S-isoprenylcysteine O-methyltransferase Ste14
VSDGPQRKRSGFAQRQDLGGERRFNDACQILLFAVFVAAVVLDWAVLDLSAPIRRAVPLVLRLPAALVVLGLALYLAWVSMSTVFGEVRESLQVIRHGLYGVVRHPMYLGAMLAYVGVCLLTLSVLAFGVFGIVVIYYVGTCRYEEDLLIQKLGDEYRRYRAEVPMFIPRFRHPKTD